MLTSGNANNEAAPFPEVVQSKAAGEESLAPQKVRIVGRTSYLLMWLGGCVSIGTFTMGSSLVGTLNIVQTVVAISIGCLVIGLGLVLNGAAGYKYGIPFMAQARSSFGFAGTRIPGIVRAVPALVWYGFQSWIGAAALNQVSAVLFGFNNLIFYFIAFQFLQIALSVFGFKGIKWLENVGSIFILGALPRLHVLQRDQPLWRRDPVQPPFRRRNLGSTILGCDHAFPWHLRHHDDQRERLRA